MPERNYLRYLAKERAINSEIERLQNTRVGVESLAQQLRRPEVSYADLVNKSDLSYEVVEQVEIAIKYAGYIVRQENEVAKFKDFERKQIPLTFDYKLVPSLRPEARQKLRAIRPTTVGQASRISGVSPADISILLVWLKRTASEPIAQATAADASDDSE